MRVKLIKDIRGERAGRVLEVSPNEAFGLIDSGKAILSKDLTEQDYKVTKSDEEQADGQTKLPKVRK